MAKAVEKILSMQELSTLLTRLQGVKSTLNDIAVKKRELESILASLTEKETSLVAEIDKADTAVASFVVSNYPTTEPTA